MTTDFELVESKQASLEISEDDASLLSAIGRELASTQAWWGESQPKENRSVIDVRRGYTGSYDVTFREVIGVVQLGRLRIRVLPKIPWEHFVYIASRSELSPRLSSDIATVEPGFEFLGMLCSWFVDSAERLVRLGLRNDYRTTTQELEEVRGSLLPLETTTEILKGRPVASCTFDELSFDTPLNRTIRAACVRVSCLKGIPDDTRRRARHLVYRMDGIGPLLHADRRFKPDRLSKSYINPISLARLLLDGCGLSLSDGKTQGTSFLMRTPEVIEDGLRSIIAEGLPDIGVRKRRQMLGDSGISMNPDIVFGNRLAIADVKYKYFGREWNRNDFNQIVAFATAFDCQLGALFGFVNGPEFPPATSVQVGRVKACRIAWPVGPGASPEVVTQTIIEQLNGWLSNCQ
ncbi:5-methylcytosine-specific restriction enzyme subunit McrC [compost metagenome]